MKKILVLLVFVFVFLGLYTPIVYAGHFHGHNKYHYGYGHYGNHYFYGETSNGADVSGHYWNGRFIGSVNGHRFVGRYGDGEWQGHVYGIPHPYASGHYY